MEVININLEQRFLGAMLGAIVGDALGWPQEINSKNRNVKYNNSSFIQWTRRTGGRFNPHDEVIMEGEYSDDGQLLIATARSLLYGNDWARHFGKQELPAWILYERGGGGATKRAAKSLSKGNPPWKINGNNYGSVTSYFNAGGNGVVMRILPHIYYSLFHDGDYKSQIMINGIYTHGHPRALLGSLLYAQALTYLIKKDSTLKYGELVDYLLNNSKTWSEMPKFNKMEDWLANAEQVFNNTYLEIWGKTCEEIINLLKIVKEGLNQGSLDDQESTLKKLGCFEKSWMGAGTVSAVAAIYLLSKYASEPQLGIIETANLQRTDSDTIASLVGGLVGSFLGTDWIPKKWLEVQDFEYINYLVNHLMKDFSDVNDKKEIKLWTDSLGAKVKEKLNSMQINGKLLGFGPFEMLTLIKRVNLNHKSDKMEVSRYQLLSDNGQIIYVKVIKKSTLVKENKNYEYKEKQVPPKKVEEDPSLIIIELFAELENLFPSRYTAKKAFNLINRTFHWIKDNQFKDKSISRKDIDEFSLNFVQKSISLDEVIKIVNRIIMLSRSIK